MGDQGFLCTSVPEEYGGLGADFLYSVIVTEETTKSGFSGLTAALHSDIVVPYITAFASEEQKHKYLPGCISGDVITAVAMTEPNAGSDLASMKTTAVEDGDYIVLNGQKTFISTALIAALSLWLLKILPKLIPTLPSIFSLSTPTLPVLRKGNKLKNRLAQSGHGRNVLYRLPHSKGKQNGRKRNGIPEAHGETSTGRLVCAVGAVAAAELMVAMTIQYCKERTAFGKPISKFQHTQFELVEMSTEAKLGRTFLDKLIMDHVEGKNVVIEVSMAKYWTTDMAFKVADRCLQLFGGYGYCDEYPISRAWRDIRVTRIFAGTNEIMKMIAARFMGL